MLARDEASRDRLATVLYNLSESIIIGSSMLDCFMPTLAGKVIAQLGAEKRPFDKLGEFGLLENGTKVTDKPEILFARLDVKEITEKVNKMYEDRKQKEQSAAPAPAQDKPEGVATLIDIAQFKQVSLRVGHILTAEKVEKADKLLKFSVQVGDEVRTIVSGIAKYYTPEEMVGKQVVVVANLKPAKLRGIESQGMLLCAVTTDGNVVLVSPEKSVPSGSEVC